MKLKIENKANYIHSLKTMFGKDAIVQQYAMPSRFKRVKNTVGRHWLALVTVGALGAAGAFVLGGSATAVLGFGQNMAKMYASWAIALTAGNLINYYVIFPKRKRIAGKENKIARLTVKLSKQLHKMNIAHSSVQSIMQETQVILEDAKKAKSNEEKQLYYGKYIKSKKALTKSLKVYTKLYNSLAADKKSVLNSTINNVTAHQQLAAAILQGSKLGRVGMRASTGQEYIVNKDMAGALYIDIRNKTRLLLRDERLSETLAHKNFGKTYVNGKHNKTLVKLHKKSDKIVEFNDVRLGEYLYKVNNELLGKNAKYDASSDLFVKQYFNNAITDIKKVSTRKFMAKPKKGANKAKAGTKNEKKDYKKTKAYTNKSIKDNKWDQNYNSDKDKETTSKQKTVKQKTTTDEKKDTKKTTLKKTTAKTAVKSTNKKTTAKSNSDKDSDKITVDVNITVEAGDCERKESSKVTKTVEIDKNKVNSPSDELQMR